MTRSAYKDTSLMEVEQKQHKVISRYQHCTMKFNQYLNTIA